VLNSSNTAHLVKDIEVGTLKKWAGFISKKQVVPHTIKPEQKLVATQCKSNEVVLRRESHSAPQSQSQQAQWHSSQGFSQPLIYPNPHYHHPRFYPQQVYINPHQFNRFNLQEAPSHLVSNPQAQCDHRQQSQISPLYPGVLPSSSYEVSHKNHPMQHSYKIPEPLNPGWRDWSAPTYVKPRPHDLNSPLLLNCSTGVNRSNQAQYINLVNLPQPIIGNSREENRSDHEYSRSRSQSQQPALDTRYNRKEVSRSRIDKPTAPCSRKRSNLPSSLNKVSDGSNSEACSTSPAITETYDNDDCKRVFPPKSAHRGYEDPSLRGPLRSGDSRHNPGKLQEESPMLHSNIRNPQYIQVPGKDLSEPVLLQETLEEHSRSLNFAEKDNYNTRVKYDPNVPLSNNIKPLHLLRSKPQFEVGGGQRRSMNQQFQHDSYYRRAQPCQTTQYCPKPPFTRLRRLNSNPPLQYMHPRKPTTERWNSLPARSYCSTQSFERSSSTSIPFLKSSVPSPRQPNDRFDDSESGKYESESRSQSPITNVLHSCPLGDAPR